MRTNIQELITNHSIPVPEAGCWLWERALELKGYGRQRIGKKKWRAHRLAYEAFIGPIPKGLWVLHRCNTRSCVNPDHLYAGTAKENTADMFRAGRQVDNSGENHGLSKSTAKQVKEIRRMASAGKTHAAIAIEFGLSRPAVSDIVSGRRWKHIPQQPREQEK